MIWHLFHNKPLDNFHVNCVILYHQAKAFLADPSAFIQAAPAQEEDKVEETAPAEEKKEESEEESDEDMGFGLFD